MLLESVTASEGLPISQTVSEYETVDDELVVSILGASGAGLFIFAQLPISEVIMAQEDLPFSATGSTPVTLTDSGVAQEFVYITGIPITMSESVGAHDG